MDIFIVTDGDYSDYRIQAVFTERAAAEAFIVADGGGQIEEWHGYDHLPSREKWYVIERTVREVRRREELHWPWQMPHYVGQRRKSWNYSKWQYGERAWGMDKGAVEKAWTEQHMAQDALKAGL